MWNYDSYIKLHCNIFIIQIKTFEWHVLTDNVLNKDKPLALDTQSWRLKHFRIISLSEQETFHSLLYSVQWLGFQAIRNETNLKSLKRSQN